MSTAKERAIANNKWILQVFNDLWKDIPQDKLATGLDNHALWTMGHLARTYDWLATSISAEIKPSCPESYAALFGMGSKPVQDAKVYPAVADLKATLDRAFAGFIRAIELNSEADLDKAPIIDTGGFAATRWDVIERGEWHTGWHSGQVSLQRKALGIKAMWG